jgi:hypothetical protein
MRREEEDLCAKPNLEILHATGRGDAKGNDTKAGDAKGGSAKSDPTSGDRSFVYRRGSLVMAVNPGTASVKPPVSANGTPDKLYAIGDCGFENGSFRLGPQSFGVWRVK